MKEHTDAGFQASLAVAGLLLWANTRGMISTHHDLVGFSVFEVIGIVVGRDLTDVDAERAPISKMFQILVSGTVVLVSPGFLGIWPHSPSRLEPSSFGSTHRERLGIESLFTL